MGPPVAPTGGCRTLHYSPATFRAARATRTSVVPTRTDVVTSGPVEVACLSHGLLHTVMNSRLTVASHVLGLIAYLEREEGRGATSDELAESVGTNAVVIRRVLGQLKAAGIVDSRRGAGGGSVLARDPREITLRTVYEAVQEEGSALIGRHANGVGKDCPVAPVIAEYLDELYVDAEEALRHTLARVTVDAMSRDVVHRVRARMAMEDGAITGATSAR